MFPLKTLHVVLGSYIDNILVGAGEKRILEILTKEGFIKTSGPKNSNIVFHKNNFEENSMYSTHILVDFGGLVRDVKHFYIDQEQLLESVQ